MPHGSPSETASDEGITRGSGNVFADIGLPDPELHLAKAELVRRIGAAIRVDGHTEEVAAERVGLTVDKLQAMLCGRFTQYPVDRLVRMLNALGRRVDIHVSTAAPPAD